MAAAQQISYYSCDFENAAVNQQWTTQAGLLGPTLTNKWYIGNATNNGGEQAMYISANNGDSAYYVASSGCATAFVELDLVAGDYLLSFDWRAMGYTQSDIDGLYVCVVPETEEDVDDYGNPVHKPINVVSSPSSSLPGFVMTYAFLLDDFRQVNYLRSSSTWRNKVVSFTADGTQKYRLAFTWRSGESGATSPGACVDNIVIMNTGVCDSPSGLTITEENEGMRVTWIGDQNEIYEVRTYGYITKRWDTYQVRDTTLYIPSIAEGSTDFYVRKICGLTNTGETLYSVPAMQKKLIYIVSRHCLDYLSLSEDNCFIAGQNSGFGSTTSNVTFSKSMVNEGSSAATSRHTIHEDIEEYDPRTRDANGKMLRTVPEGEIASVRLGNWCNGHEAERLEFQFHVDTMVNPMVMLLYAVVIEEGEGHSDEIQPRFEMKILNSKHQPLKNSRCVTADFTANDLKFKSQKELESEGWHRLAHAAIKVPNANDGSGERESNTVYWKDWTQVGVNLKEYHGQDVIVQLSTYDCAQTAHFGYAYFVLKCSKGELEGMSCGEVNPTFRAPEGFEYRWYKASDYNTVQLNSRFFWDESLIVGRNRELTVSVTDTLTYAVDCMFPTDTVCYFTLYASSMARFPKAEGKVQLIREDCQNKLRFSSSCYIEQENQVSGKTERTAEMPDYVWWDFGDGTTSYVANPVDKVYPGEAATYRVVLHAVYQTCEDSVVFNVDMPYTGPVEIPVPGLSCTGVPYERTYHGFDGDKTVSYDKTGVYRDTILSSIGCDSIIVLDLLMIDSVRFVIDTTIMNDGVYVFNTGKRDTTVTTTGTYYGQFLSKAGCDSLVIHNVFVHDRLTVDMSAEWHACANEPSTFIPFTFSSGRTEIYSLESAKPQIESKVKVDLPDMPLTQTEGEIEVLLPQPMRPDYYPLTFTFYDDISGDIVKTVTLVVHYADTIMVQKWDDAIALRNAANNGGYSFNAYQWYRNGEKLEGQTQPYLYLSDSKLDQNATYSVELTRDDGVVLLSCPMTPNSKKQVTEFPTIVGTSQKVVARLREAAKVSFYTPAGALYSVANHNSGAADIVVPAQAGLYIMAVSYTTGEHEYFRVLVTR